MEIITSGCLVKIKLIRSCSG